jgi:hypothetical protein
VSSSAGRRFGVGVAHSSSPIWQDLGGGLLQDRDGGGADAVVPGGDDRQRRVVRDLVDDVDLVAEFGVDAAGQRAGVVDLEFLRDLLVGHVEDRPVVPR